MSYIRWLGHAAFELSLSNRIILIDPWITNPLSPITLEDIKHVDFILVTHDHGDHLGETVEICKKTNAVVVGVYELTTYLANQGVKNTLPLNIGGLVKLTSEIEVYATPAQHSSTHGSPCGFIIKNPEITIYHAGDTGLFKDMELIGELFNIDLALIPIGGVFTMSPREACIAIKLLRPRYVIPMHYNTFPEIRQDPQEFKDMVEKLCPHVKVLILKPGDKVEIPIKL